ncbi:MAG: sigma-70 family RNA polymerase sigma factor [Chloroflexota bacterium]|nr:sigma-70 family RNA polymerase sigma factor [Chloroflexota bacterium]
MGTAPVLAADADPTPAAGCAVTVLAVAARAGDPDALASLYTSLEPKISRFVRRYRGWERASWDAEDVSQEAYLALVRLLEQWSGEGPFLPYFFACYRFRLRDAVCRLAREERTRGFASTWREMDDQAGDAFTAAELRADLAALSPADRALLQWRIEEGERVTEVAERLGVNRRTVHRRWERLRVSLHQIADELSRRPRR